MPSFYESKRDQTAYRALKNRGFPLFIKYQVNDNFNEVSGGVVDGTDKKTPVYGLFLESKTKRGNPADTSTDTLRVEKVRTLMITATGVPAPPSIGDILEIDTVDFIIKEVEPLNPGNVDILYTIGITS